MKNFLEEHIQAPKTVMNQDQKEAKFKLSLTSGGFTDHQPNTVGQVPKRKMSFGPEEKLF
jgi:dihydroxyacetone kinase